MSSPCSVKDVEILPRKALQVWFSKTHSWGWGFGFFMAAHYAVTGKTLNIFGLHCLKILKNETILLWNMCLWWRKSFILIHHKNVLSRFRNKRMNWRDRISKEKANLLECKFFINMHYPMKPRRAHFQTIKPLHHLHKWLSNLLRTALWERNGCHFGARGKFQGADGSEL